MRKGVEWRSQSMTVSKSGGASDRHVRRSIAGELPIRTATRKPDAAVRYGWLDHGSSLCTLRRLPESALEPFNAGTRASSSRS
jgi:hypothetical protein